MLVVLSDGPWPVVAACSPEFNCHLTGQVSPRIYEMGEPLSVLWCRLICEGKHEELNTKGNSKTKLWLCAELGVGDGPGLV